MNSAHPNRGGNTPAEVLTIITDTPRTIASMCADLRCSDASVRKALAAIGRPERRNMGGTTSADLLASLTDQPQTVAALCALHQCCSRSIHSAAHGLGERITRTTRGYRLSRAGESRPCVMDRARPFFGLLNDREIAERIGSNGETVRRLRVKAGIPALYRAGADSACNLLVLWAIDYDLAFTVDDCMTAHEWTRSVATSRIRSTETRGGIVRVEGVAMWVAA